jgi:hypothetical protein
MALSGGLYVGAGKSFSLFGRVSPFWREAMSFGRVRFILAGSHIFSVRSILAGSVLRNSCTSEFNRHRQTDRRHLKFIELLMWERF